MAYFNTSAAGAVLALAVACLSLFGCDNNSPQQFAADGSKGKISQANEEDNSSDALNRNANGLPGSSSGDTGSPVETGSSREPGSAAPLEAAQGTQDLVVLAEVAGVSGAEGADILKDGTEAYTSQKERLETAAKIETLEREYPASRIDEQTVTLDLMRSVSETTIALRRNGLATSANFTQIDRPILMDSLTQGRTGSAVEETFTQNDKMGLLDLLVVVDNSGSMAEEQENLSTKLQPLLSYVANSDWQIGVTTTDPNAGCLRDLIKKSDPTLDERFKKAVSPGTSGNGNEQGIRQAVEGLKASCLTQGWVRQQSTLAVLIVSDEDNCSDGQGCKGQAWETEAYLTDYLRTIRRLGENARIYGLFWHPEKACSTAANKGVQYLNAVLDSKGTWGSICDADYTQTLQAVSKDIAAILEKQFVLKAQPDPSNTRVYVNDIEELTGWKIVGSVLEFSVPPAAGAKIRVSYVTGSKPIFQDIILSQPAAADGMAVKINGMDLPNGEFSFDKSMNKVSFLKKPAENAQIVVHFRKDVSLITRFSLGAAQSDSIKVTVNGAPMTTGFTYDGNSKELVFAAPPQDGAKIAADFLTFGEPILAYDFPAKEQADLKAVDAETGISLGFTYDGKQIRFQAADYADGRKVNVIAKSYVTADLEVRLNHSPIPQSIVLLVGGAECKIPELQVSSENELAMGGCDYVGTSEQGVLKYRYVAERFQEFSLPDEGFNVPHDVQVWSVWIDGELTTDYTIDNHKIRLGVLPLSGQTVKVSVALLKRPSVIASLRP